MGKPDELHIQLALHMTLPEWEDMLSLLSKDTSNIFHLDLGRQLEQTLERIRAEIAQRELADILHSPDTKEHLH